MTIQLENAYVIGQANFEIWSKEFDNTGYLKVLPHPDVKIPFKDPFRDWQKNIPGNYASSWGPQVLATIEVTDDLVSFEPPPEPYDYITEKNNKLQELINIVENRAFNRERTFTWVGNFGSAIAAGNPTTLEGAWRINGEYFSLDFDKNMMPLTMPIIFAF